ncbi:MAG TPA: hypothetical protein VJ692_13210 [Nitrospiraceae bacterium]|nr:hypothetical protein [Nitrospiraceae bacterium]
MGAELVSSQSAPQLIPEPVTVPAPSPVVMTLKSAEPAKPANEKTAISKTTTLSVTRWIKVFHIDNTKPINFVVPMKTLFFVFPLTKRNEQ